MTSVLTKPPVLVPAFTAAALASVVYSVRGLLQHDLRQLSRNFFLGPGRLSRILLLFFVLTNLKSLPLSWTVRDALLEPLSTYEAG
jgi:hypothetical protein